jgi:hypothetical protein
VKPEKVQWTFELPLSKSNLGYLSLNVLGGRGGIRTLETREGLPVFKTGTFNHSVTLPSSTDYTSDDPKIYRVLFLGGDV